MLDAFLVLLAPHSCCSCGKLGDILCLPCKNDIILEPFSRCLECLQVTSSYDICLSCQKKLGIEAAWCIGVHEDGLKRLLARYKFASARAASLACVELLDATLPVLPDSTVIVPVPTASAHVRVRGFNHIERITSSLAKKRGLKHLSVLGRYSTATQHFKTKSERLATAASGLEVVREVPDTVLLVDDIYTTGATVKACVTALKASGARHVFVAIVARQTLDETT